MKTSDLSLLLSLTAGYVDTAGFLGLQGLFTAHVTGNFVTFGAALAQGTTGIVPKLAALPFFCLAVFLARLAGRGLESAGQSPLKPLLAAQCVLLCAGFFEAVAHGPFVDGDAFPALAMGMTLVTAMAIQNAIHRGYMSKMPPTTLMTGTMTQIMVDIADLLYGSAEGDRKVARDRMRRMGINVVVFALGCGLAAGATIVDASWCFVLPPILIAVAVMTPVREPSAA